MKRRLGCLAWCTAGLLLAAFAFHTFVGSVYRIESGSMEPTLHAGDYVFVKHGLPASLQRYDVLALRSPEDGRQVVKRLAGLPRESIGLRGGDLIVDGSVLAVEGPRPAPVLLFDSDRHELDAFFLHGTTRLDPWSAAPEGTWRLDAQDVGPESDTGLMCTREPMRDDYLDAAGVRVPGATPVEDVGFEGEVRWLLGAGRLRVRLGASWDTYQLALDVLPAGGFDARLTARAERDEVVLGSATLDVAADDWHRVEFRLLDGHARVAFDGAPLFSEPLPPRRELDASATGTPLGGRCCFGGEGVSAEWRALRVYRDLHWPRGSALGPGVVCDLGPDELFVLGDNAADSRDSRAWGPVAEDRVLGRAELVVWPPSRMGRLPGAVAPPGAAAATAAE